LADLSDPAIRKLASEILSRREFQLADRLDIQGVLGKWLATLLSWISRLQVLHAKSPLLYWVMLVGLTIVAVALMTHIVLAVRAALRVPEPPAAARRREAAPDLVARAESLAGAGRHLEAAHWLMIASFQALAEGAVIELRPDRSNAWIRAALMESTLPRGLSAEIASLVTRTEQRWFGDRADRPEIYLQWRSAFERLRASSG
jgi:hypothetical protein